MEATLFLLTFPVVLGIVLGIAWVQSRRHARAWGDLATALGFTPMAGASPWTRGGFLPPLQGSAGPFPARLVTYTTGSGKNQQRWTSIEVPLPEVSPAFTLRLTREGLGGKLLIALGGQDVKTGDDDFDRAFRIRASDEGQAQRALEPFARQALAGLKPFGEVRVEPALVLGDGSHAPATGIAMLDAVLALPGGPRAEQARDLFRDAERRGPVALLRYTREGLRADPDATRAALQAVAALGEAVTRAARPEPTAMAMPMRQA